MGTGGVSRAKRKTWDFGNIVQQGPDKEKIECISLPTCIEVCSIRRTNKEKG